MGEKKEKRSNHFFQRSETKQIGACIRSHIRNKVQSRNCLGVSTKSSSWEGQELLDRILRNKIGACTSNLSQKKNLNKKQQTYTPPTANKLLIQCEIQLNTEFKLQN